MCLGLADPVINLLVGFVTKFALHSFVSLLSPGFGVEAEETWENWEVEAKVEAQSLRAENLKSKQKLRAWELRI